MCVCVIRLQIFFILLLITGLYASGQNKYLNLQSNYSNQKPNSIKTESDSSFIPLRYLAINVGNASPHYGCWEYRLCRAEDVLSLRSYINTWQPDIIMFSEILMSKQLMDTMYNGPVLPEGYDGVCGKSVCRYTGQIVSYDADDASHEHECIAWKTSRLELIQGSELSVYGRNDEYGKDNCKYCFTGFRAKLLLNGFDTITAVAVHPNATDSECRIWEISEYWSELATGDKVIIGGDFNSDDYEEIQVPDEFKINFSKGHYWDLAYYPDHYSLTAAFGLWNKHLDHAFSNFGKACTDCGIYYETEDLVYGAAIGGYNDHPRADGDSGFDHRQLLIDMKIPCALSKSDFGYFTNDLEINFTDSSNNAKKWDWYFGDGNYSDIQNPNHLYNDYGNYDVCLTTTSECGSDTLCKTIELKPAISHTLSDNKNIKIFPTLVNDYLIIESSDLSIFKKNTSLKIYNTMGVLQYSYSLNNKQTRQLINLSELTPGAYIILINNSDTQPVRRVIIKK